MSEALENWAIQGFHVSWRKRNAENPGFLSEVGDSSCVLGIRFHVGNKEKLYYLQATQVKRSMMARIVPKRP